MKRKLSYRIYSILLCVICSLMMIVQGVVGRLGSNGTTSRVQIMLNFALLLFILIGQWKIEKLDELARRNVGKAALGTFFFTLIVLSVMTFSANEKVFTLLPSDLFFAMGGIYLSFGVQFFIFDKWGKA